MFIISTTIVPMERVVGSVSNDLYRVSYVSLFNCVHPETEHIISMCMTSVHV